MAKRKRFAAGIVASVTFASCGTQAPQSDSAPLQKIDLAPAPQSDTGLVGTGGASTGEILADSGSVSTGVLMTGSVFTGSTDPVTSTGTAHTGSTSTGTVSVPAARKPVVMSGTTASVKTSSGKVSTGTASTGSTSTGTRRVPVVKTVPTTASTGAVSTGTVAKVAHPPEPFDFDLFYGTPGGNQMISGRVSIDSNGIVTSVEIVNPKTSQEKAFASGIGSRMVGKPVKGLRVEAFSGASLTIGAFNSALMSRDSQNP